MKTSSRQGLRLLEVWIVFSIFCATYGNRIEKVEWHGDESQWIATSCYGEAFFDRDFTEPEWLSERGIDARFTAPDWVRRALVVPNAAHIWAAHYWTLTQPPLTRYTIALGRLLGGYEMADLNAPWDFEADYWTNCRFGACPARGLLWSVRAMMAFLAVLSGMTLFLLVRQYAGAAAGYTFVILFVGSAFLRLHLRRAMSESPLLFFTCLTLLLAVCFLRERRQGRALVWLALMGVGTGLAGAVKLNGLGMAAAGVALCGVGRFRRQGWRKGLREFLLWSAVFLLVTAFTFTIVNPFLYPNPPARTVALFLFRGWEMRDQTTHTPWVIPSLGARLWIIPRRLFKDYTLTHWPLLNQALLLAGLFFLGRSSWRWQRKKGGNPTALAILAVAAVTALPPLLTPLDWDRYYLYPVVFISVGVAVGLGQLLILAWRELFLKPMEQDWERFPFG